MSTDSVPQKRCSRCKVFSPLNNNYFSVCRTNRKDGFLNYCKRCAKEKHDEWVSKHRRQLKEYDHERRQQKPELYRNAEKRKKEKHHSRMLAYWKLWAKNNPEKVKVKHTRRRTRKVNAIGCHTSTDIDCLYINQRGLCAYCSTPLHGKYHVDHVIPLSRGGTDYADNLTLTCPRCNLSKGDKLLSEWETNPRNNT